MVHYLHAFVVRSIYQNRLFPLSYPSTTCSNSNNKPYYKIIVMNIQKEYILLLAII